ncbi:MAG: twin-arginine translocase TatA/TatE family subunit [Dehalococcoidia bacterium]
MDFFGIGPAEVLLILIVGLIALGPGKLPHIARNLGKGMTAFKKATMDLTTQVSEEFREMQKEEDLNSKKGEAETDDINLGKDISAFKKATMDFKAQVSEEFREMQKEEDLNSKQDEAKTEGTQNSAENEPNDGTR